MANTMNSSIEKLKTKWGLDNNLQVLLILIAFTLSGSTVVWIRPMLFRFLGLYPETSLITKSIIYLLIVLPLYQCCLFTYGTILGQYHFFSRRYKKFFQWVSIKV